MTLLGQFALRAAFRWQDRPDLSATVVRSVGVTLLGAGPE
jgi:hypothetical protein